MQVERDGVNNKYLSKILASNNTNGYIKFMIDVAKAFGSNNGDIIQEVKKILDFETKMSKVTEKILSRN